ncbi:MAG TPA: YdeI/OmpD-associated family protein [Lacunisphaera sp.]
MPKNPRNPKVDAVLAKEDTWQKEFSKLRDIVLGFPLTEELKWGCACYTLNGSNVVLIHGFKEYCALLFTKGALLKDPEGLLIQQTKNVQAARQLRFSSLKEIVQRQSAIKACLAEAIAVEKAGIKVEYKQTEDFEVVPEFQARLRSTPSLKAAFEALTPGRQRGYLLHFAAAKQSKTREARIEKSVPAIYAGKGLNDV